MSFTALRVLVSKGTEKIFLNKREEEEEKEETEDEWMDDK